MFLICPDVFMNLATLFLQSLFLQKMCRTTILRKYLTSLQKSYIFSSFPWRNDLVVVKHIMIYQKVAYMRSDYVRNKAFSVWCLVNLL